jgi:hypothetical protein
MIRIAITEAALAAIAKTLPEGTVLHVDRRFIHLKEAIVDRLGACAGKADRCGVTDKKVARKPTTHYP